jgi:hypothetical protein
MNAIFSPPACSQLALAWSLNLNTPTTLIVLEFASIFSSRKDITHSIHSTVFNLHCGEGSVEKETPTKRELNIIIPGSIRIVGAFLVNKIMHRATGVKDYEGAFADFEREDRAIGV